MASSYVSPMACGDRHGTAGVRLGNDFRPLVRLRSFPTFPDDHHVISGSRKGNLENHGSRPRWILDHPSQVVHKLRTDLVWQPGNFSVYQRHRMVFTCLLSRR